ncbi:MAG: hypothetical protein WCL38_02105 [Actinomycetota bacterium]
MTTSRPNIVVRLLKGFAMFWWDFLVGDTPELFVATLLTLGVVALLSVVAELNLVAWIVFPLLVAAALSLSVRRAVRSLRS